MTTASTITRERKTTRTQGKAETPPGAQPCARCKILIFADARQIPKYLTSPALHQAQGDYCPECAKYYQE